MSTQENDPSEDSDNFGLPEIDFKPLDRDSSSTVEEEPTPINSEQPQEFPEQVLEVNLEQVETSGGEDEPPSSSRVEPLPYVPEEFEDEQQRSPLVVGFIIALLILAAAGLTYFFIYKPKAEKANAEKLAKERVIELKRKATQDSLARIQEEERRAAEAKKTAETKPAAGTIETLSEKTGRYYVVVSSNLDDDLILDFAKKLSAKGVSSKIIPPFGKVKYYRLSLSDEDTFAKAQANADAAKAEYGNGLWVMKY